MGSTHTPCVLVSPQPSGPRRWESQSRIEHGDARVSVTQDLIILDCCYEIRTAAGSATFDWFGVRGHPVALYSKRKQAAVNRSSVHRLHDTVIQWPWSGQLRPMATATAVIQDIRHSRGTRDTKHKVDTITANFLLRFSYEICGGCVFCGDKARRSDTRKRMP